MIEQADFIYSSLEKASEKPIKTIEDQRRKQFEALKVLRSTEQKLAIKDAIPEDQLNEKAKNKTEKMKKMKK